MHAQRVRRQRLSQALLEGLLLQLQEDAVCLLPLGLTLLRGLPPAPGTNRYPRFGCAPGRPPGRAQLPFKAPNYSWGPLKALPYLEGLTPTKTGNHKSRYGVLWGTVGRSARPKQLGQSGSRQGPHPHWPWTAQAELGWHFASPQTRGRPGAFPSLSCLTLLISPGQRQGPVDVSCHDGPPHPLSLSEPPRLPTSCAKPCAGRDSRRTDWLPPRRSREAMTHLFHLMPPLHPVN